MLVQTFLSGGHSCILFSTQDLEPAFHTSPGLCSRNNKNPRYFFIIFLTKHDREGSNLTCCTAGWPGTQGILGFLVYGGNGEPQGPWCYVVFPACWRPWKISWLWQHAELEASAPLQAIRGLGCFLSSVLYLSKNVLNPRYFWEVASFWEEL